MVPELIIVFTTTCWRVQPDSINFCKLNFSPGCWGSDNVCFQVLERPLLFLPQLGLGVLHVAVDAALVLVQLLWSLDAVELLRGLDVRALKVVPINLKETKVKLATFLNPKPVCRSLRRVDIHFYLEVFFVKTGQAIMLGKLVNCC